ncbi:DUF1284 domain-containing protein [candidate division KSB1 bacterium]|nr:DUF1284 domain-containing protein [candidate division KSB1 bacterium]
MKFTLRPHHILDIIVQFGGKGMESFQPHPYGHAVHTVAQSILGNSNCIVKLVAEADDICAPCKYLSPERKCTDVITAVQPPVSKQDYNDRLDQQILSILTIEPGTELLLDKYLKLTFIHFNDISEVFVHPNQDGNQKARDFLWGLQQLQYDIFNDLEKLFLE